MVKKRIEINMIDFEVKDGWTTFTSSDEKFDVSMRMPNSELIRIAKLIQSTEELINKL